MKPQLSYKRRLQRARQIWRMCAAAEFTFAKSGHATTVADILKNAGMSRRSYYEYFSSLENIIARITYAADAFDRGEAGHEHDGMVCPSVDFMLCSAPLDPPRDVTGIDFNSVFEARKARALLGPESVPDNEAFLLWYAETVAGP